MLPFTAEAFLKVFEVYNEAIWPAQVLAYALGLGIVLMVLRPTRHGGRAVLVGLAAMWLWTGIVYHAIHFSAINRAAPAFGALFALQGVLFLHAAVTRPPAFGRPYQPTRWAGWFLVAYAGVLYPLLGVMLGHHYPAVPTFGITPCPLTLFTFGVLLLTTSRVPAWLLAIPFVWSLIGGSAAFLLGVAQDWLLLVGALAAPAILLRDRRAPLSALGRPSA